MGKFIAPFLIWNKEYKSIVKFINSLKESQGEKKTNEGSFWTH